eukprot:9404776-Pyramimonas_sp.AAC.1
MLKTPTFSAVRRSGSDLQALAAGCRDDLALPVRVVTTYQHLQELLAGGHAPLNADKIAAMQEI